MLDASSADKTAVFDTLGMKMGSHICFITSVLINKNTLNNLRNKSCRMSSDAGDSIPHFHALSTTKIPSKMFSFKLGIQRRVQVFVGRDAVPPWVC